MKLLQIIVLILLISPISSYAASSGDDNTPVGGSSGGGGGGGAPQFYDYYVPLVFSENHTDGMSEIVVWLYQQSVLITTFAQDKSGTNQRQVQEPQKFIFNPTDNFGLTNGSLIRTTTPALVVGQRFTEDILEDKSFAYSILNDRMMGYEFISPVNGFINVMSSQQAVNVNIDTIGEDLEVKFLARPFTPLQISVKIGTKINATGPISGAFISYIEGTEASMAVPKYLQGNNYVFSASLVEERESEEVLSYISIIPEQPTELTFIHANESISKLSIFGITNVLLTDNLRGINSSRGDITLSIHQKIRYTNLIRKSMLTVFAASEMRAGEVYLSPMEYSNHYINPETRLTGVLTVHFENNPDFGPGYYLSRRTQINMTKYDTFNDLTLSDANIVFGNDSLLGIASSPGLIGHPMSPSASFINIPLNGQSSRNITGLEATWYRFPNLAAIRVDVVPGPIEELTGQKIEIEIQSNGSLPAGNFKIKIQIDQEEPINLDIDFMPANSTMILEYDRFMNYNKQSINVSVIVDVDLEVNEINEDDNIMDYGFNVLENIRLKYSVILFTTILVLVILQRIRVWLKRQRSVNRAHVDVLITEEVLE